MSPEEEQKEYKEFWAKFISKADEVNAEFHKLSPSNQKLIRNQINQVMALGGVESFIHWLKSEQRNMSPDNLLNQSTLISLIHSSLAELYSKDHYLIDNTPMNGEADGKHYVGERAIVFRFAHYLLSNIEKMNVDPDLSLDCEYNRNGCLNKALPSFPRGVIPDVIIHKRGSNDKNVLVMEFKTYWNDKQENDEEKIKELTDQQGKYKYAYGMTVLIGSDKPKINLFVEGKKIQI